MSAFIKCVKAKMLDKTETIKLYFIDLSANSTALVSLPLTMGGYNLLKS
jgi:hypothetical protein